VQPKTGSDPPPIATLKDEPPGPANTKPENEADVQSSLPRLTKTPLPAGIVAPLNENPKRMEGVTFNTNPLEAASPQMQMKHNHHD